VKFLRTYEFRNLVLSLPALFLWTNLAGAFLSILIFAFLQFGIPIVQRYDRNHPEEISRDNVCEFIEIFLLGTNAGLTKLEAFSLVLETTSEPLRSEISRVISRCNMGIGLTTSLSYTAERSNNRASTRGYFEVRNYRGTSNCCARNRSNAEPGTGSKRSLAASSFAIG